jgi:glycosyltransferase involved in cell wall biosynthesis
MTWHPSLFVRRPKVSIGLPIYNGEKYLSASLISLLDQSFTDFEIVISDNASTDRSAEIVREFAKSDPRIRYYRNETNIGLTPNHNRVFELSSGEFFKWASHDDVYPREMLQRYVEVLEKAPPTVALVYSEFRIIDEFGNRSEILSDAIEKRDAPPHLRLKQVLTKMGHYSGVYALIRSEILRKTRLHGPFPDSDKVMIAELAMLGEIRLIKEPLFFLREHPGRSTRALKTPEARRAWMSPAEAKKSTFLSILWKSDLEVVRSAFRLPIPAGDKIRCLAVAMGCPVWRRILKWTFPVRKRFGLAPSVWRNEKKELEKSC